uniref:Uncharacterized protein n=1 Tax=Nelumbo nucifera TaxID=4432 RepID=A0A822ZBP4_NELNU|nr:TPA_asm: hypothetical protein HUJ06_015212 [Nelumbo nucifera]
MATPRTELPHTPTDPRTALSLGERKREVDISPCWNKTMKKLVGPPTVVCLVQLRLYKKRSSPAAMKKKQY